MRDYADSDTDKIFQKTVFLQCMRDYADSDTDRAILQNEVKENIHNVLPPSHLL